jgi:hypothetical protein
MSAESSSSESVNPYQAPEQTKGSHPPARSSSDLLKAGGFSIAAAALGGGIGATIGALIGALLPGYYRSVFSSGNEPYFDPIAVGIGQGLGQGIVLGLLGGIALVVAWWWLGRQRSKA